jgi:hypothetical protein
MHTVMSGMDPHMISETWDGFCLSFWLGHVEVGFTRLWVGHGETPWHNQDHYLWGDEFATLLQEYLRNSC